MSKFKIKETPQRIASKITRIEMRCDGNNKVLTLNRADTHKVYKYITDELANVTTRTVLDLPVLNSPIQHVPICRIQIFETVTSRISKKENFKSFTCYGIDEERAYELISKMLNK